MAQCYGISKQDAGQMCIHYTILSFPVCLRCFEIKMLAQSKKTYYFICNTALYPSLRKLEEYELTDSQETEKRIHLAFSTIVNLEAEVLLFFNTKLNCVILNKSYILSRPQFPNSINEKTELDRMPSQFPLTLNSEDYHCACENSWKTALLLYGTYSEAKWLPGD